MHFAAIQGYVHRLSKNGDWVRRWFELDGEILCSYKNSDKPKILNAVNLKRVSEVEMVAVDSPDNPTRSPSIWHIKLGDTPYFMESPNESEAKTWVMTLNKHKNPEPKAMTLNKNPRWFSMLVFLYLAALVAIGAYKFHGNKVAALAAEPVKGKRGGKPAKADKKKGKK